MEKLSKFIDLIVKEDKFLAGVKDANQEIILNLDNTSLARLCRTSKTASELFNDELFWNRRIQRVYNVDLGIYKKERSYREIYKEFILHKELSIHNDNEDRLLAAAKIGCLPLIKYFVERGVDINGKKIGESMRPRPLRLASEFGHLSVVKYLVKHGAEDLYFEFDTAAGCGQLLVLKYLMERESCDPCSVDDALMEAVAGGHLLVVEYLLEKGANIDSDSGNAFSYAAGCGQLLVVKYLVERVENIYAYGDEALESAADNGCYRVVKYLLEQGADIHAGDDIALYSAIKSNHYHTASYLIKQGATIYVNGYIRHPTWKSMLRYLKRSDARGNKQLIKRISEHLRKQKEISKYLDKLFHRY